MAIWIHLLASTEALTNGILDIITTSFFFFPCHHIVQGKIIKKALQSCCALHLSLKTHALSFSLTSFKEVSDNTQTFLKAQAGASGTMRRYRQLGLKGSVLRLRTALPCVDFLTSANSFV